MLLRELEEYTGQLLVVERYRDHCPNGVQVEGKSEVTRIATGVTASLELIEQAEAWGADAILVHHGYFWKNEEASLRGVKRNRIARLLSRNISLLAYHLPLDSHELLGNNVQLAKRLGVTPTGRFGEQDIGWIGTLSGECALAELALRLEQVTCRLPILVQGGKGTVSRIAWCTGGAQNLFQQAIDLDVDVFITGEASEPCYHLAKESGVAFIAAGHHATERYGVQALGEHLSQKFGLEHRYFDLDNPI